jgi:hypothetical protein
MHNQQFPNQVEKIPFLWRWLYPLLLTICWGGLLGIVIAFSEGISSSFFDMLFGGFAAGAIIAIVLWVFYETPIRTLLYSIPYMGLLLFGPWLLYWLFVWPTVLIDKLIAMVIRHRYSIKLSNKSLLN